MLSFKKLIKLILTKFIFFFGFLLFKLKILNFFIKNLSIKKQELIENINQSIYLENIINKRLICLDIGSKGGIQEELRKYNRFLKFICVEPDDFKNNKNKNVIKKALWNKEAKKEFYITKNPFGSSLYKPDLKNFRYYYNDNKYISLYKIKKKRKIDCSTIEKELIKLKIKDFDYLKIDTQGSEFNILRGLGKFKPLLINIELQSISLYKGAPNWIKVMKKLDDLGYSCLEIRPVGSHETHLPIIHEAIFIIDYKFRNNLNVIEKRLRQFVGLLIIFNQIKYLKIIKEDLDITFNLPDKDPFFF